MKLCGLVFALNFFHHQPTVEELDAKIHRAFTDESSIADYMEATRLLPDLEREVMRLKRRHEETRLRQLLRWLPDLPDGRLQLQLLEVRKRIEE